jgi:hypothetical protein
MISAWWLLLLLPIYVVGHMIGYLKCLVIQRRMSSMVKRLLQANNVERAIRLLDTAQSVEKPKQQKAFSEKLKELDT